MQSECAGYLKVGIAVDLDQRLAEITKHKLLPVRVVFRRKVFPTYVRRIEMTMHYVLRDKHHRGEWSNYTIDDVREAYTSSFGKRKA
jgi:hypothetical protein